MTFSASLIFNFNRQHTLLHTYYTHLTDKYQVSGTQGGDWVTQKMLYTKVSIFVTYSRLGEISVSLRFPKGL